jgi:drug/metabolite transporter (DMT)-like permease
MSNSNNISDGKTGHLHAYVMIVVTVFLWAIGVVIARAVHEEIPLIGLSFWRWLLAAVILLPFVIKELRHKAEIVRDNIRLLIIQGILIVGSGALLFYALNYTTVINATLVNATQPVITLGLAWILLQERLQPAQLGGILSAVLGVGIMVTRADWQIIMTLNFNKGDLLVIMAITGYALYAINIRKMPKELGTFAALAVILFFGSLFLLPFYLAEAILIKPLSFNLMTAGIVFILAIIVSILAMGMWNYANHIVGPSRAAVFVNLLPVYGAVLAISFLNEELFIYHLLGALLVCTGIFMVVKK